MAIATFAIATPPPRVSAAPASACTPASGVTVIVDFAYFGGAIERGCAAGKPATALVALHEAGFATAGTANFGDAFVCRIDGLPLPKAASCAGTPPGDASWSFYFAKSSDKAWTYSALGVTSYQPSAGSLMAFAFGNHAKPGVLTSGAIATRPTTAPPTSQTTTARVTTAPVTSPRVTAAVAPPTTVAITAPMPPSSTATTGPPRATTTRSSSLSTTTASSTTSTPIIDRSEARIVSRESSGSPVPAVFAGALVAIIGAVAILMIRARRRRSA